MSVFHIYSSEKEDASVPALALAGMLLLVICTANAAPLPAPSGWTEKKGGKERILTRGRSVIRIGPWVHLAGQDMKSWLESKERDIPSGGVFISSGGIKAEKTTGGYSVSRVARFGRSKGRSILYVCPGTGGSARLLELHIKDGNYRDLFSGGLFLEQVCKKEPKQVATVPAKKPDFGSKDTPGSMDMRSAGDSPVPGKAQVTADIKELIYYGEIEYGIDGAHVDWNVVARLADGSCTRDVQALFREGGEQSRRRHPDSWGKCRMHNGELQVRWGSEKSFETVDTYFEKLKPRRSGERLAGCWRTISGQDNLAGAVSIAINRWCFDKNGRFSNEGAMGVGTGNATGHAEGRKAGRYHIEGYAIRLVYDDDTTMTTAFGLDAEKTNLILGNGVFSSKE